MMASVLALSVFDFLFQEQIEDWILSLEPEENLFQELGRKLPSIGDYKAQECLLKILFKFHRQWAEKWFTDDKMRSLFLNINQECFSKECRRFLNQINRFEEKQRVFSFVAISVTHGFVQCKKPVNSEEFWIDFNYDSESISFDCMKLDNDDESIPDTETVRIDRNNIEDYTFIAEDCGRSQVLLITLKSSGCDGINEKIDLTSSVVIKMKFYFFHDIKEHLENLFDSLSSQTNIIQTHDNHHSQRRVSNSADLIFVDVSEDLQSEAQSHYSQRRKISNSSNFIVFDDLEDVRSEVPSHYSQRRKISNSSSVVVLEDAEKQNKSKKFKQATIMPSDKDEIENRVSSDNQNEEDHHGFVTKSSSRKPPSKRITRSIKSRIAKTNSKQKNLKRKSGPEKDLASLSSSKTRKTQKSAVRPRRKRKGSVEEKQEEIEKSLRILKAKSDSSDNEKRNAKESEYELLKKPEKKLKKMFLTDTETGSSTISWLNPNKHMLFESPERTYYKRKAVSAYLNERAKKSRTISSRVKSAPVKKRKLRKHSDSETGSRRAFSDIDSYPLVVEKGKKEPEISLSGLLKPSVRNRSSSESSKHYRVEVDENNSNQDFNVDASTMPIIEDNAVISSDEHIPQTTSKSFISNEQCIRKDLVNSNNTYSPHIVKLHYEQSDRIGKEKDIWNKKNSQPIALNVDEEDIAFNEFADGIESNINENIPKDNKKHPISSTPKPRSQVRKPHERQINSNLNFYSSSKEKCNKILKHNNKNFKSVAHADHHNSTFQTQNSLENIPIDDIMLTSPMNSIRHLSLQVSNKSNVENSFLSANSLQHNESNEKDGKEIHIQRFLQSLSNASSPIKDTAYPESKRIGRRNSAKEKRSSHKSSEKDLDDPAKLTNKGKQFRNDNHIAKYSPHPSTVKNVKEKQFDDLCSTVQEMESCDIPKENFKEAKLSTNQPVKKCYLDHSSKLPNSGKLYRTNGSTTSCSSVNTNTVRRKPSSSLSKFANEVNVLNQRLLRTMLMHTLKFRTEISLIRQNIVKTAEELILQDSVLKEKDLKCLAENIQRCRFQIQNNLKKILRIGQEYFIMERRHNRKMKHLHEKAMAKYITGVQEAKNIAINSLEQRLLSKAKAMCRAFFKKIRFF